MRRAAPPRSRIFQLSLDPARLLVRLPLGLLLGIGHPRIVVLAAAPVNRDAKGAEFADVIVAAFRRPVAQGHIGAPVRRDESDSSVSAGSNTGASSAPRLSIVVLPFINLSDDPNQQYFADGITDDVTTDLSRIPGMLVISRNTALTYQNKSLSVAQIGRELAVRYALEGTVRRSGDHVRINAQLIDAETDAHLWADRFDRDVTDLFAVQDEVVRQIAAALSVELVAAEAARSTDNSDVLDYILRGRAALLKPPSREIRAEQIGLFERALALDPRSFEAQSRLAISLTARVLDNMTNSAAADIARAEILAEQALVASPRSPVALYAKGQVLRAERRYAEAIPEYEAVLASNRNWVFAMSALGQCKLFTGAIEETIPLVERAIRLSPRDPLVGQWFFEIGRVHLLQSRTEEAIVWLEKARRAMPGHSLPHAWLASAYALKGESERAAAELAEARALNADDRYTSIARWKAIGSWGVPKIRALFEATFFAGLREAGIPEE
jgi:adenylate cyclase